MTKASDIELERGGKTKLLQIGPLGWPGGRGRDVRRFDETCRESHTLRRRRLHCLVGDIFNLQGNQGDGEP